MTDATEALARARVIRWDRHGMCDCTDPTVHDAEPPAVLLRDTDEDRERLARRMHDHFHDPFGHHEFGVGCADGEIDADGWRKEADAIIAALRERP